ncbi:endoplasmic reticulum membrane-associated RNA degradation protein-like [Armigeres subalbatus]|uniref:endoplasmic reticulum membrane-associated RNA degradation protein-like n=1 Tax=Armigeres subalbatus TaxID=124917 RepID=UPI002ED094D7
MQSESSEKFFSDEIACMLLVVSCDQNDIVFTEPNGTLDWKAVEQYFADDLVTHDQPLSYEQCSRLMPKLHALLKRCPTASYQAKTLNWTNRLDVINEALRGTSLTCSLMLSAILEYSLGNIVATKTGSAPPHLLRDLLMTDTLANVLGETMIYLLRLLLGTPNGINFRNLAWHGFLSETDVDPVYPNFLLVILTAVGQIFEKQNLTIECRSCTLQAQLMFDIMGLQKFNVNLFKTCLNDNRHISETQFQDWMQTLEYYNRNQYYSCMSRALPQLEMYLRRVYSELHQKDFRAKLDEYYIIMDTVFEEHNSCTGNRNLIFDHYSTSLLELAYDLLAAINGPRIRDKLSHGELQIDQVNEPMAKAVLYTCYLIITNEANFAYKSVYHPNAILRTNLKDCKNTLEQIAILQFPVNIDLCESSDDVPFVPQVYVTDNNVRIFHRPEGEEVVIGFLQRIAIALQLAAENLHQALVFKINAMERRELRSRARNSFCNMLKMLPTICRAFEHVLNLIGWIFYCLMEADEIRDVQKLIRFMKFILKYTENAAINLDAKTNIWLPLYETSRRELYDKTRQNLTLLLC